MGIRSLTKQQQKMSPGLVVMGGDSRSEGRGFRIPVPYFFHINLL